MTHKVLTQEKLKQHVFYDPITGVWIWKIAMSNRVRVGGVITNTDSKGYRVIVIEGIRYRACRLAFLYVKGKLPINYVKHVDNNRLNDIFSNLSSVRKNNIKEPEVINETGVKGLTFNRKSKRYQCRIMYNRSTYYESFLLTERDKAISWLTTIRKELNKSIAA
jgi:hypothetical protein